MNNPPQDLTMFAGDSLDIDVPLPGNDLTGVSITWVLKRSVHGEMILTKTVNDGITITDALNGLFTITLEPKDTAGLQGGYYHAAKLWDVDLKESTLFAKTLTIVPSGI